MRLAIEKGWGHPDLLLAVLTRRQMNEIEVYAGIEAIDNVSQPKGPDEPPGPAKESEGMNLFNRIKVALCRGAKNTT